MNKKLKTFFKIIYYLFTFGLGIVLAFVMPGMKYYQQLAYTMENSFKNGDYDTAMSLIGGYYDDRQVFEMKSESGTGVVIYSAATLSPNKEQNRYYMNEVYAGFLFNAGEYPVKSDTGNKTKLVVEDVNGTTKDVQLLNYDSNKDKNLDMISTLEEFTYVYFEIPIELIDNVNKLTFLDREGNIFFSQTLDETLYFQEKFFEDVRDFKKLYNASTRTEEQLDDMQDKFLSKNQENYKLADHSKVRRKADTQATAFVLIYFVWIYILGDFLVGHRFIWHGLVWCYSKIRHFIINKKRKKKGIEPLPPDEDEVCGNLNTLLKVHLIVPKDCNTNVSINYHNENNEINLVLTRDNSYTQSMVVPSGSYVNAWLECPGYHTVNLPKTLDVKGYRMTVEVTLEKSDKNLMDDNEIINNKMEVKDENHN